MGREWYFGVYRYLCGSKKSISIMMKALQNRTTIRRYKGDDVSEELLNGLLEQAARTQTMGNLQLYSVVVTRDERQNTVLRQLISTNPWPHRPPLC